MYVLCIIRIRILNNVSHTGHTDNWNFSKLVCTTRENTREMLAVRQRQRQPASRSRPQTAPRVVSANVNVPIIMQFERQFRNSDRRRRRSRARSLCGVNNFRLINVRAVLC